MTMTTEETQSKKWKYAAIIAGVAALLVAGGFLAPASWVTIVTGMFL